LKFLIRVTVLLLVASTGLVTAQSLVTTVTLGPDQIGLVKTAQGITTRITFADPVMEIVCGDLYDAATGKGSFVVQRSGTTEKPGNDVFVKPITSKGMSNLFVTTGDSRKRTFNFDLKIVSVEQSNRVVNVVDGSPRRSSTESPGTGGGERKAAEPDRTKPWVEVGRSNASPEDQARQHAAEIIRNAQQQADQKILDADARILEAERQSSARADQEVERRFLKALMLGVREARVEKPKVTARRVNITLDPNMFTFDDKAYLRYTIQNTGIEDFSFSSLALEVEADRSTHLLTIRVNQSKPENTLAKDESLNGVIVFEAKLVGLRDRLSLIVRAEDNSEIARLIIQQP
jgi:hypothetical protein